MKQITLFYGIAGALLVGILFASCDKSGLENPELADRKAEYALPLFNTTLNVKDLADNIIDSASTNSKLTVNPDQTITLSYSGDVSETPASKIYDFLKNLLIPVPTSTYDAPINAGSGLAVRNADISSGIMSIGMLNSLTEPVTGFIYMPTLTKDGNFYSATFTILPNQTWSSGEINMAGWNLVANNDGAFRIAYEARLPNGDLVELPSSVFPSVLISFYDLKFSYLEGFWGKQVYPLTRDTIEIDINQTNLQGDVKIKNPRIKVNVFNSWGFPTRGLVKFLSFRGQNGELIPLVSPLIEVGTETGIDFAYPSLAAGEVGQTKVTSFFFDDTNSNIEEIFNSQPTEMIYEVEGLANANNDPTIIGFITGTSTVRLNLEVELTLEGQLKNFEANQNLDLDFNDLTGDNFAEDAFEFVEFKLVTDNSIPMSIGMQIFFENSDGVVLDSLFVGDKVDVLRAAPVNADGVTTGSTTTETFIPMGNNRFNRLRREAKKARMETYFTTSFDGNVPVKILANQQAAVRMGVRLKLNR